MKDLLKSLSMESSIHLNITYSDTPTKLFVMKRWICRFSVNQFSSTDRKYLGKIIGGRTASPPRAITPREVAKKFIIW